MTRVTRALGFVLVLAVVAGFVWRKAWTGELSGDRSAWNVLILTLDTTRADRLGAYGFAGADTPNIDRLAREGVGLTLAGDDHARDAIARGELGAVLEEFSAPFPGFHLCYPQRRQASPALRALVDYLRRARRPTRA